MIDNLIIEKAIEEIENGNLGITEQFLEIHKIAYVDNKPQVARIDRDRKDEAIVYFNVEGEMFYFFVYVDLKPAISVRTTGTEPYHSVKLIAISDQLSMKALSELTTLTPTKGLNKGDRQQPHYGKALRSFILFEPNPEADEFEDKLTKLLDYLEQDKEGVGRLVKNTRCLIRVWSYFHNGTNMLGGYYVNADQIKRMSELNLSIEFDVYATGNLFKEA